MTLPKSAVDSGLRLLWLQYSLKADKTTQGLILAENVFRANFHLD
jgi:hypothetical protein